MAPRYVLRRVLDLYEAHGWEPVWRRNSSFPGGTEHRFGLSVEAAGGRSGRPEIGRQAYSIAAVNEFDPLRRHVFILRGPGHRDRYPDPRVRRRADGNQSVAWLSMSLADQAFLSSAPREKRPCAQNVRHFHGQTDGQGARQRHASASEHRRCQDAQEHLQQLRWLADLAVLQPYRGLQKYLPGAMSLFAPNVTATAISVTPPRPSTCIGATTTGPRDCVCRCRAPKRVASRTASACGCESVSGDRGLVGLRLPCMIEGSKPSEPISGSAYDLAIALPRTLAEALRLLRESKPLVDLFGDRFVLAYTGEGSRVRDLRAGHQFLEREHCCQRLNEAASVPGARLRYKVAVK